jgi:hypothetical protein
MGVQPIVVRPGEGHRVGNVEFLARTADTPRFTFAMIEIAPGRELEAQAGHATLTAGHRIVIKVRGRSVAGLPPPPFPGPVG